MEAEISRSTAEPTFVNDASVPRIIADGVQIMSNGTDVHMVFTRSDPDVINGKLVDKINVSGKLSMSRGAAADLQLVLVGVLDALTREFGQVDTHFLKSRRT